MSSQLIGLFGFIFLFILIALRVQIAVAMLAVSLTGIFLMFGADVTIGVATGVPYNFSASWTLSSVPMFLLMGYVAYHAGITKGLFDAARAWLAWLPGGLAVASMFGATGFAAATGSSIACAAAIGRIAIPEMLESKYDARLATGTVAAAGTIGALVPPSILLILFAIQAQVSIIKLFFGGALIGFATLAAYSALVIAIGLVRPQLLPVGKSTGLREKLYSLRDVWPLAVIVVGVFGSMFAGLVTATEAGAIGAFLTIAIGLVRRSLGWKAFRTSVVDTLVSCGSLFIIAVAANIFVRFVALAGINNFLADLIASANFGQFEFLLVVTLFYLVVGMFLEPVGAMLLTLPILLPALKTLGIPELFFGVMMAKLLEIGMITPPVGMNVFVIHGVLKGKISLEKIFSGVVMFIAVDIILVLGLILLRGPFFTFVAGN